jgi:hypothetical protein
LCAPHTKKEANCGCILICQEGERRAAPKAHGHGHSQSVREVYAPDLRNRTITVAL